jgi:hypothetical protein
MNKILLLSLVFFSFNTIAKKGHAKLKKVDIEIEYVDSKGNHLDRSTLTKDLIIRFPYITGSIFGRTENKAVFLEVPNSNYEIELDLFDQIKMVKKYSSKLKDSWHELGLTIKPKNTKILRIGTFPYDLKTTKLIGSAGFKEKETGNLLMLVYVSKKSQLFGDVRLGDEKYSHDISFPSKGFYWLTSIETSKDEFKITRLNLFGKVILSIINNDIKFI